MDAVTEELWNVILECTDKRSFWVNMRRLWRALSDWSLDGDQCFQEFRELEAYKLIVVFPGDDESGTRLLIRKKRWFCPNCGLVNELPTEHIELCLRKQRKLAEIRQRTGDSAASTYRARQV
jgi:hypothetical protein